MAAKRRADGTVPRAPAAAGRSPVVAPRTRRVRLTAEARHRQLVDAAVHAFAAGGYAGATTEDVARLAGVSQPYVVQVFGTKQALFLAAVDHAVDEIEAAFHAGAARRDSPAAPAPGLAAAHVLPELGASFVGLLERRELLLVLLHGFAASADPAIGAVVRRRFGGVYRLVRELSGADAQAAQEFLATGMLLTVLAAMEVVGADATGTESWAAELLAGKGPA